MSKITVTLLAATAAILAASPASARGCNGVVNQLVWGCAAWDNNNGPQYPNWHGAPARNPSAGAINRNQSGIVAQGGGNLYSPGVRNGNGIVAQGGGN